VTWTCVLSHRLVINDDNPPLFQWDESYGGVDPIKESFRIGQLRHLSRYDRQRRRNAM